VKFASIARPSLLVCVDRVLLFGGEAADAGFVQAVLDVFDVLGVFGVGERFGQGDVLQARRGRLAAPVGFNGGGRVTRGELVATAAEVC
jgi:hypothetical protein